MQVESRSLVVTIFSKRESLHPVNALWSILCFINFLFLGYKAMSVHVIPNLSPICLLLATSVCYIFHFSWLREWTAM